jgi:hypothetical protein
MMYVSANEKAVSLNVHRYNAARAAMRAAGTAGADEAVDVDWYDDPPSVPETTADPDKCAAGGICHFSPRYFAVKTPVTPDDDSQSQCNQSDTRE